MSFGTKKITLLAVLLLLAACDSGKSSEQHITRAQQYLDKSDYNAAVIELKNSLQIEGGSAQARWLLGSLYLETGNIPSAEKELLQAQSLGWDSNDVRPALAETLLAQAKYVQIREMPYEDLEPTAAARLFSTKALAELAQGDIEQAEELIDLAAEREPNSIEVKMAEARVMTARRDLTGALIVLDEALEQTPELAEAWSQKGDIMLRQGEGDAALDAFNQAISLSQKPQPDERFKRALINLQKRNFEAARTDAEALLKASPQSPAGNYIQGILYLQNKNYPDAISALSLAEPAAQHFPLVLFYLSGAHLLAGNQDQAGNFANRFHNEAPRHINGRKLLASIQLQRGNNDRVEELLQPVLDVHPEDIESLYLMGEALMRSGRSDQGLELLARMAKAQPDSATAQLRLGAKLLTLGKQEEAEQQFVAALEINPDFQQADILLVLSHVQQQDFDKAIEASKAYIERNPASVTSHNLLGRVLLAAGRKEEAVASFEEALALDPGDPSANINMAKLAEASGDFQSARQRCELILEYHPGALQALLQLAYLDAKEQKEDDMVMHLQTAMDAHSKALAPRILLARYYLFRGKADQVAVLFADLDDLQKQVPEVMRLQARAQLAGKQHLDAQYTLEQLIASNPETPQYHHLLALAALGTGDTRRARAEFERAVALDDSYQPSLVALARITQAEGGSKKEFQRYVDKLTELAPDVPDVLQLRAAAAHYGGDSERAAQLASSAFAARPNTQSMLDVAIYQTAAGNPGEARRIIQLWVDKNPQDIRARTALAEYLMAENKAEDAMVHYNVILEQKPDHVTALNNLAWHNRLDNPEVALEYARRAAERAPDRPEVLDTLAVIEHLNGDNRRAKRNIQRALATAPGNPSLLYHQAMIEAAVGETGAAVAILDDLLGDDAVDFPEREEARALLASLKG